MADNLKMIEYYINDIKYTKDTYSDFPRNELTKRSNDKPNLIRYSSNNKILEELYFENGARHRDIDKPAEINYNDHGRLVSKLYYKNGKLHREGDKPAVIGYQFRTDNKLVVYKKSYFLYGQKYKEIDFDSYDYKEFKKFLKLIKNDSSLILTNINHNNYFIQQFCKTQYNLK